MKQPSPQSIHIVVHSPALDGSRRVTDDDVILGVASHLDDVIEILRLANLYQTEVEVGNFIEWQGGGPYEWPGLTDPPE